MSDQFAAPEHLSPEAAGVWDSVISESSNPALIAADELAAYCNQVVLERDCARRVREEGTIVADERGRPIPHPAIAVGRQAALDVKNWAERFL
ncbi:P27 family phage terminase small subunit [Corynebacterium imitans]|uniref:P27 family phage terminase small subunit n=1 Tax=Corynebacterium imitans TaxID=156978 RepID=UPI00254F9C9C|nr:P27 family phage terminase small subunit [Corynebacterium imitans]MDK8637520.1 P27 family phage terminase small subunit [Corynebacterium imitans]MDK8772082.1 P27 family phage terminase small subunit [Corynebacterium imitans]